MNESTYVIKKIVIFALMMLLIYIYIYKAHFEVFPKEKGGIFIMPCFALVMLPLSCHALPWSCFALVMLSCFAALCHVSLDKICIKDKNF